MHKIIKKIDLILIFVFIIFSSIFVAQEKSIDTKSFPILRGPYLGQKPPGMTPEVFAPDIVSIVGNEFRESDISFWPDGKCCIFARFGEGILEYTIFETRIEDGKWLKPYVSRIFKKSHGGYLPCVSPDGSKIFLTLHYFQSTDEISLGFIEKTEAGWSEPKYLFPCMYGSLTSNDSIYYDLGGHIARRKYKNSEYQEVEIIGAKIYSRYEDGHPCIALDESYIVFDSSTRPGVENNELFVSFRTGDNTWTEPKGMAEVLQIKPSGKARLTSDGKYLFFHSKGDIYWVDTKVIEELKQEELR